MCRVLVRQFPGHLVSLPKTQPLRGRRHHNPSDARAARERVDHPCVASVAKLRAEKLWRRSRDIAELRSDSGVGSCPPHQTTFARTRGNTDQPWPDFGQTLPNILLFSTNLSTFGPESAGFGPTSTNTVQSWAAFERSGSNSTKFGQIWPDFDQILARSHQLRATMAHSRTKLDRSRPALAHFRKASAKIGARSRCRIRGSRPAISPSPMYIRSSHTPALPYSPGPCSGRFTIDQQMGHPTALIMERHPRHDVTVHISQMRPGYSHSWLASCKPVTCDFSNLPRARPMLRAGQWRRKRPMGGLQPRLPGARRCSQGEPSLLASPWRPPRRLGAPAGLAWGVDIGRQASLQAERRSPERDIADCGPESEGVI